MVYLDYLVDQWIMFDSSMQEFERQSFPHPSVNWESAGDVNHLHPEMDR